ncbi:MAG: heavy metal-responsive transcriptional regulator [Cyanobacteria bacterium M5B4]|nr:MAG: heavy metal-responsive transcriptional regulator [Cyanobacteria bacterium M5B4]
MMQVKEVAQRLHLNPQTLYFYERIGMIPPPHRTPSGYRLYTEADVERLEFIMRLKCLGFTLEEIKDVLTLKEQKSLTCRVAYQRIQAKITQIKAQIAALQALCSDLMPILEQCANNLDRVEACVVFEQK